MKQRQSDADFIERVSLELDRSIAHLDPDVTTRLHRARRRAMSQERKSGSRWLLPHRFLPAFAVAAALLLFVVQPDFRKPAEIHPASGIEDVEILSSRENPDFFHELDFYSWLAEEMDRAG